MPPKPRPRPRPAGANARSSETPVSSGEPSKPAAKVHTVEEEDAFFMRNRNMTANDWKKIDQREREASVAPPQSSDPEDGDLSDSPPTRKRRRPGTKRRNDELPAWTKGNAVIDLSFSSDSDDDTGKGGNGKCESRARSRDPDNTQRNKRQRSRSASLTPPPELTYYQIQNARNVVREALAAPARPISPTWEADESTDTIVLDPELARIAAAARSRVASQGYIPGEDSQTLELDRGGGPENVTVRVRWRPHPLNQAGMERLLAYKLKRHDSFATMCEDIADEMGILSSNIVLTYEGGRVFSSATPHSLKLWAEGDLEASDKATFEYLRAHRNDRPPAPPSPTQLSAGDTDTDSEVESAAEEDDTFKLVVRAGGSVKDVTLTVRPTTTAGSIVKAFLKRAGLAEKYPEGKSRRKSAAGGPRLVVDGDPMNPAAPISDADLEDGDMVEIRLS